MNLQKKILISFLIMILTPCIIIGILGFIATGIGIHGFRTGNNDTIAIITQPIHALTELTQTEYNELSS